MMSDGGWDDECDEGPGDLTHTSGAWSLLSLLQRGVSHWLVTEKVTSLGRRRENV